VIAFPSESFVCSDDSDVHGLSCSLSEQQLPCEPISSSVGDWWNGDSVPNQHQGLHFRLMSQRSAAAMLSL